MVHPDRKVKKLPLSKQSYLRKATFFSRFGKASKQSYLRQATYGTYGTLGTIERAVLDNPESPFLRVRTVVGASFFKKLSVVWGLRAQSWYGLYKLKPWYGVQVSKPWYGVF